MAYVKIPTVDGHDCFINTKNIAVIETHRDDPNQCAIGFLGGFQILSVPLSGGEVVSLIKRAEIDDMTFDLSHVTYMSPDFLVKEVTNDTNETV